MKNIIIASAIKYDFSVDGSSSFSHSLSFDNCMTTLICFYLLSEGQCFQDISPPIKGPLNSPFTLLINENTFYYYVSTAHLIFSSQGTSLLENVSSYYQTLTLCSIPMPAKGQKIHSIIPHQLNSTISPKPGEASLPLQLAVESVYGGLCTN